MLRSAALLAIAATACLLVVSCGSDPNPLRSAYSKTGKTGFGEKSALFALAERAAQSGDHSAAIPLYRRAHEARPKATEPLLGLGRSLAATGQYHAAHDAFERALKRDSSNPSILVAYGTSLLQTNRPTEGLRAIETALAIAPDMPEGLRGKAYALDLLGRHDEALVIYGAILATAPKDVRTLNNYGLSLALHGATETGITILEQALHLPDAAQLGTGLRQNLALAYLFHGRIDDARRMIAIDAGVSGSDQRLQYLHKLSAQSPTTRLATLMEGPSSTPMVARSTTADGLDSQQVAALRVIARDDVVVVALPGIAAPPPSPKPVTASAPRHIPGQWTVQVAAYRKPDQLAGGWDRFKALHGDLLDGLHPQKTEIDFGDTNSGPRGIYYRLNAGPLPNRAAATTLCKGLKARGTTCFVRSVTAVPLKVASRA